MPTPSDDTLPLPSSAIDANIQRPTCPPDNDRASLWRPSHQSSEVDDVAVDDNTAAGMALAQEQSMYAIETDDAPSGRHSDEHAAGKSRTKEDEDLTIDSMSSESVAAEMKESEAAMSLAPTASSATTSSTSSYNYEFSNVRVSEPLCDLLVLKS